DAMRRSASRTRAFAADVTRIMGPPVVARRAGERPRPPRRSRLARGRRRSRLRRGARLELEQHLVVLDHAELRTRTLLDRLGAGLEIAHVGIERVVARLELRVHLALCRQLAIELARREPSPLAEPQRI